MAYYTAVAGFSFWYWVPALNLLTVQYVGVSFFDITPSVDDACWIVLLAEISTFALMIVIRPLLASFDQHVTDNIPGVSFFGIISLFLAMTYLITRFASDGSGVLIELATGLSSAREVTNYQNFSGGIGQSFLALWEILTINLALIILSRHLLIRTIATLDGSSAMSSIALMFVASGTRTVLLQTVFVVIICLLVRQKSPKLYNNGISIRRILFIFPIFIFAWLVSSAFISRFSADTGYAAAGPAAVILDTLFVNNDMMRELAFVVDTMQPSSNGYQNFFLTPFTYMLPAFLGFEKDIPYHLLAYNQTRLGIDLYTGEGNIFPGLVADFWLLFGWYGPLLMSMFVSISALSITRIAAVARRSVDRQSYIVASLSYLFFDFRNITGAFVLVLVSGAAMVALLSRVDLGSSTSDPVTL